MRRRMLQDGSAVAAGLSPEILAQAVRQLRLATETGQLPGAVLLVARRGLVAVRAAVGHIEPRPDSRRMLTDDLFLVASLTKPLVCLLLLRLVEEGLLLLDDPVRLHLPELRGAGTDEILVRHLLCHTSGLPDRFPGEDDLRRQHASLDQFLAVARDLPTAFRPGTDWAYQSVGFLLLAEIARRLTGESLRDLLQDRFFGPLGCRTSVLGLREGYERRLVPVNLPAAERHPEWDINSPYWRSLGAPWGGLHSTADELAVILQMMLNGGSYGDVNVLAPAAVREAISDQTSPLPDLPEPIRRRQRWGFGWRLTGDIAGPAWPDLVSARTFGHTGATGVLFWADPESEVLCVLLTNQPGEAAARLMARISTMVAAAWV